MVQAIEKFKNEFLNDADLSFVLKGGLVNLSAKIIIMVLGIVSNLIIAKYYGAFIAGILAVINSFLSILLLVCLVGADRYLLKLIPKYQNHHKNYIFNHIYKNILQITLVISLVISLIIIIFSRSLSMHLFGREGLFIFAVLLAPILIMGVFHRLNTESVRALGQVNLFNFLLLLPSAINIILLILFTVFDENLYAPVYIRYFGIFTGGVISFFVMKQFFKPVCTTEINNIKAKKDLSKSRIIKNSLPMLITSLMNNLIANAGIIIMGLMMVSSQVGIYNIAFRLGMITNLTLLAGNTMLAPKISELYHSNKQDLLLKITQSMSVCTFISALGIALPLVVFGRQILSFLGEEFVSGYFVLVLVIIAQLINVFCGAVGYFLQMTGNQKAFMNIVIIAGVLNLVLNVLLINKFGIYGAALANMLSVAFINITAMFFIRYKFGYFICYIPFVKNRI